MAQTFPNLISRWMLRRKILFRYVRRKGWRRLIKENLLETEGTPEAKAKSVALGIFVGLSPLWGFQTVIVLALAAFFRLSKALALLSSQISLPPLLPFLIIGSMTLGAPFVQSSASLDGELDAAFLKNHLFQYLIGSLILATFASIVFGLMTYFLLKKTTGKSAT